MQVVSSKLISLLVFVATFLLFLPFLLNTILTHRAPFPHERIANVQSSHATTQPWRAPADSKLALSYRLSFTLLVEEPDEYYEATTQATTPQPGRFRWEIADAVDQVLMPQVLDPLSALANFSVDSQVLYYSRLAVDQRGRKSISVEDLQGFLSANDFDANSMPANDREHPLHFMLFVSVSNRSARVVKDGKLVESFVIPRWGGVMTMQHEGKGELALMKLLPVMEVFAGQLLYLLGMDPGEDLVSVVSSMQGKWLSAHVSSALETLASMSKLIAEMTHMPVLDRVSQKVDTALDHLEAAIKDDSLVDARLAVQYAEEAFFDPSLVPQLYFPTEHMIGVHLPLVLPVVLPVAVMLKSEIHRAMKLRKQGKKTKSD